MKFVNYEKARTEGGTFEFTAGEETFTFPNEPSAEFAIDFLALMAQSGGRMPEGAAVAILPTLIGDEDTERLIKAMSFPELQGFLRDLLLGYELIADKAPVPNPTPPISAEPSSESSGRSKVTSSATTD